MKFDFIIGNPPYQESDGGNNASAVPVYQKFIKEVNGIYSGSLVLIIPARWYSGGRGLDDFRKDMLQDKHMRCLVDYVNADECFPGVDISGGVCYFLRDIKYVGDCKVTNVLNGAKTTKIRPLDQFNIFIRSNEAVDIVQKVVELNKNTPMISEYVSSQKPFGLRTYVKPEERGSLILRWNGGRGKYPSNKVTVGVDLIEKWKVVVSRVFYEHGGKVDKNGQNRVLSILEVLKPKEICTETYIVINSFDSHVEAVNLEKYLKAKFVRFLILQASSSIMITRNSFIFVPLQDFTPSSDIDWSVSIPEIDQQLYAKYGLDENEIAFIESHVKEMV